MVFEDRFPILFSSSKLQDLYGGFSRSRNQSVSPSIVVATCRSSIVAIRADMRACGSDRTPRRARSSTTPVAHGDSPILSPPSRRQSNCRPNDTETTDWNPLQSGIARGARCLGPYHSRSRLYTHGATRSALFSKAIAFAACRDHLPVVQQLI